MAARADQCILGGGGGKSVPLSEYNTNMACVGMPICQFFFFLLCMCVCIALDIDGDRQIYSEYSNVVFNVKK